MSVQSKIDQRIAKLQKVRKLLADPETLALVKEILAEEEPSVPSAPQNLILHQEPIPAKKFRGTMTRTAYQCVLRMNQPFTGRELIENMRETGYEFCGHPEVSIHTPLKKLIKEKVLEIVEQGIGRHATVYQRRRN